MHRPRERNIIGVIAKVGAEVAGKVVRMRKEAHEVAELLGGRRVHPVGMMPGGQSKAVSKETAARLLEIGRYMVDFAGEAQTIFDAIVLKDPAMRELIASEAYISRTSYMALVNEKNQPDPYDGIVRVVDPDGAEILSYEPKDYLEHFAERIEPWSYLKFPYLKSTGWLGLSDETAHAIVRTGPLGSLNAADGMQTPLAQAQYERFFTAFGGKPVHATLAYHWARLIEMMQAAELVVRYATDERLIDPEVRTLPTGTPREGVGTVEAPRGLLTHHYVTDENGIVDEGEPHRRHDLQLPGHPAVRPAGGDGPGPPGRRTHRDAHEPHRDGVSRVRPVLRVRDARASRRGTARGPRIPARRTAHRRDPPHRRRRVRHAGVPS